MALTNILASTIPANFSIIFEIGIMIIVAGVLAFIFKMLKQPRIPAYIIAGIILGPMALGLIQNSNTILALSEIGVAFLLFFAGLEIEFSNLKRVGKISLIAGIIQMGLMALLTLVLWFFWDFKNIEMIQIILVVAFSSTMVVIKILADKEELNTLHGRIIVGILLIQDIAAVIALTILTSDLNLLGILIALGKAGLFIIFALILAKLSGPIFKLSAKSSELILIIALAFLFLFAISAYSFGLSLVIGAFFAGVALANSPFKVDIKGRVHPLRDFFGAILFVSLGMQLVWIPKEYWGLFGLLIVLVMIIKPIVLMVSIRLLGYTNRTAFLTGNSLGQSSEFALILLTQGLLLSQISQGLFSVLVFVVIISMSLTIYFMQYESALYKLFLYPARLFERVPTKKEELNYGLIDKKKVIIFGCHRTGTLILKKFSDIKEDILIIDFNPDIIRSLMNKKIPCLYGDLANPEIIKKIKFMNPEIIISTIPDIEDNLNLVEKTKKINSKVIVIVMAEHIHEALELYKKGADYVILPKVISGLRINELIDKIKRDRKSVKKRELDFLNDIHYFLYK
ncbi:MAG: cation:proton antiporter [Candidatus Pacearchaeota archaeon]|jgi:Kef-type K+ transport system membrane component KefB